MPREGLTEPTHYPQRMSKCEDTGHNAVAFFAKRAPYLLNARIIDATVLIKNSDDDTMLLTKPTVESLPKKTITGECGVDEKECDFLPDHNPHYATLSMKDSSIKIVGWNIEGCCASSYNRSEEIEHYVCSVLKNLDADIICIQEVILKADLDKDIYTTRLNKIKKYLNRHEKGNKWKYKSDGYTGAIFFKSCRFFTVPKPKLIDGIPKPDIRPILYIDFEIRKTGKLFRVYNIHLVAKESPIDKLDETKFPLQKPRYHFAEMLRLIHLTELKEFLNEGNYVIFCGDHNDEKIQTIYELITQYLNDRKTYSHDAILKKKKILENQNITDIKDLYSNLDENGQLPDEYFNENNVNSLTETSLNKITNWNKHGLIDPRIAAKHSVSQQINRPYINPMNNAAMYNAETYTTGGRKTKKNKPRKKTKKPRKKTRKNKSRKKQKIY